MSKCHIDENHMHRLICDKKLHELANTSEYILTSYNMRGVSGGKPARLFKSGKSSAET